MKRLVLWLLAFGLVYAFVRATWPVLTLGAVTWLVVRDVRARSAARRARIAGLCARADAQHAAVLRGDPVGTYGRFPPVPV